MSKFVIAFFLAAHGLIHLGYLTPAPADPNYPFRLSNSWLVTRLGMDASAVRAVGIVLSVVTIVGFAGAALAALGIVVPSHLWSALVIVAAVASLLLLALFWHMWLVLGVAIDVAMLIALVGFHWEPLATADV